MFLVSGFFFLQSWRALCRFALVIRESGDGPAAAISAQQVLSESKLRSSKKCKWKVQLDENDDGSDMTGYSAESCEPISQELQRIMA
eukprot:5722346-Amphidinium_carterae.1